MKTNSTKSLASVFALTLIIAVALTASMNSNTHAQTPSIDLSIAKSTYQYCERLSYTVSVSEVTGQAAVIRIIDQNQKSSNAIPIPIEMLESEIKAPFPFERSIFPTGTYTINMTYSGAQSTASFEIVDGDSICIPSQVKQIAAAWMTGAVSDGFLIDVIKKSVDAKLIEVPFEIDQENIYNITIPKWVKTAAYWWIADEITDSTMSSVFDYLLKIKVIGVQKIDEDRQLGLSNET